MGKSLKEGGGAAAPPPSLFYSPLLPGDTLSFIVVLAGEGFILIGYHPEGSGVR